MRIDEIVNHIFTRSFMGYDIEQVDVFLDDVIETLERNEAEKREMLAAMEYLMKQLEHGKQIPLADMKKAIDSGRSQGKPLFRTGSADEEQRPHAPSHAAAAPARRCARRRFNRVQGEDETKAQIIQEAKAAIPQQELTPEEADMRAKRMSSAAVNWLDELLINIAEHETFDYDKPLQAAEKPQAQPADAVNPQHPESTTKAAQPPESNA